MNGLLSKIGCGCLAFGVFLAGIFSIVIIVGFSGGRLAKPTGSVANAAGGWDCSGVAFVPGQYMAWVKEAAGLYLDGDEAILIALIQTESSWNPKAGAPTSSARGLGQFVDKTAQGYVEFTGGVDPKQKTWPPGALYDRPTFESHPDDARYDPERSIYAAARKFSFHMDQYGGDPSEAYIRGYHTFSNAEQEAAARRGAERMMNTYNQIKSGGGCSQGTLLASATPFECSGKSFVFPIVTTRNVTIPRKHHHYSATDIFVGADLSKGEKGLDGDPIVSVTDGEVVAIDKTVSGSGDLGGITVRIQDKDGIEYYYAHLQPGSNRHLSRGEQVKAGQEIGRLGDTGNAAGNPHLHFGISDKDINQKAGWYPSRVRDPRPAQPNAPAQDSNYGALNAWKEGRCVDPRV